MLQKIVGFLVSWWGQAGVEMSHLVTSSFWLVTTLFRVQRDIFPNGIIVSAKRSLITIENLEPKLSQGPHPPHMDPQKTIDSCSPHWSYFFKLEEQVQTIKPIEHDHFPAKIIPTADTKSVASTTSKTSKASKYSVRSFMSKVGGVCGKPYRSDL